MNKESMMSMLEGKNEAEIEGILYVIRKVQYNTISVTGVSWYKLRRVWMYAVENEKSKNN